MPGDDELLDLLARTFAPAPAEPSLAELTALRNAVRHPAATHRWRLSRRSVAALVGASFLLTSGTAFAVERDVPPPVRSVAHAIGLPVDSTQEHAARSAATQLRHALGRPDDDSVRAAASVLRSRLQDLPPSDRRHVGGDDLLRDADERLSGRTSGRGPGSGGTGSDATAGGTGGSTGDDHGGDDHRGDDGRSGTDTRRQTTSTTTAFRAPTSGSSGSGSDSGGSGSGGSDGSHATTTSTTSTTVRSGDGGSGGSGTSGSGTSGSGSGDSGTSSSSGSGGGDATHIDGH